jgi:hypothetical protein
MPKATANIVEPERHELKTLPEGFVVLRRLTYGQKLERKAMASVASAEQGRGKQSMKMQIAMISEQAQLYDFTHCVMEHNLEGDNGELLNFSDINAIRSLDPRIGEEIERLMDSMNNFEEDDPDLGN